MLAAGKPPWREPREAGPRKYRPVADQEPNPMNDPSPSGDRAPPLSGLGS